MSVAPKISYRSNSHGCGVGGAAGPGRSGGEHDSLVSFTYISLCQGLTVGKILDVMLKHILEARGLI